MTMQAPLAARSSATVLALAYACLLIYASLYPFSGWSWPATAHWYEVLHLPLPPWRDRFDIAANLAGYLPLGLLVFIAGVRQRRTVRWSVLAALGWPALLSLLLEITQHFLPGRHPSMLDWLLNSAGALLGLLLGLLLRWRGLIERWQALRERWFIPGSAGALVLLWLWPMALLFPAPVPLGLGPGWGRIQDTLIDWLIDVPWAQAALELVTELPVGEAPLPALVEGFMVMLGLLAPCLLAHAIVRSPWRRALVVPGAVGVAWLSATLSTALNFGPAHALGWVTPTVPTAFALAALLALGLAWAPQRLSAALGLMVLALLVLLVAQAPEDPYFAYNLQAWEQGRFVRFHGLAQWLGWLWPFAAGGWLMLRVSQPRRTLPSAGPAAGGLPTIPP